jgi:hypothetical protein
MGWLRPGGLCLAIAFLLHAGISAADLDVVTVDTAHRPIAGVEVALQIGAGVLYTARTSTDGHARFAQLPPAQYDLTATKEGLEPAKKTGIDLTGSAPVQIELALVPALARTDSIDVKASTAPIQQEPGAPTQLPPSTAKELPGRPQTVSDALPLVPGVVRKPGGGLAISGAGEHRSALVVNSADVTDPATGQFGLTVPIDVVQTLNVYQTPFLAEYGRFSAGVVSVETRRGGDQWKWELNDPFPEFRIRSYHLRGLRDATPRINVEGPIIKGKLYFSEGTDYEVRKTPVYELPFPHNQKKQAGFNSFAQLDWIASDSHLVTATLHVAPQHLDFVNMDYFNPEATTPEARTQNYTSTIADKLTILGGVLENTFSFTQFNARVWGQGDQRYTMTPEGNSGSYFAQQDRRASRFSFAPTFTSATVQWLGTHTFKTGGSVARSAEIGEVAEHAIDLLDGQGRLYERIDFTGGQRFRMRDLEAAAFGQDHWLVTPKLAFDLGVRAESQELSESFRVAPRAGVAWTPFARSNTVIRAGYGLFYDRLPLNVYSFKNYPTQSVSYFDSTGQLGAGPYPYLNLLGTVTTRSPFVFREQAPGNFSPSSTTGNIQIEQIISPRLKLRVGYLQSESSGLVLLNRVAPDPVTGIGTNLLTGNGQSRYHQFDVTARVRWDDKRQLFFSYVRSRARGDLNDFSTYLGTFALPILRDNQFGTLPADLPNRFLAWGLVQLPLRFRIAPIIEYRNGLPYSSLDATYNWAGIPNSNRFPSFLSIDARVSKDFQVNPKYAVRLSVSGYNLTNHFNPEAVHANTADPLYGYFFGHRGRRFTADFDVVF